MVLMAIDLLLAATGRLMWAPSALKPTSRFELEPAGAAWAELKASATNA